jgi:uncharacterized OsmC-like protein
MSAVNIRDALEKLDHAIATDPGKARAKGTPATARLVEGLRCEVTGPKGETVYSDMPAPMGRAASAPNPGWLLRGAMASCTATCIAMRAARLGIALKTLEITVESDSDHRGILGLDDRISAGYSALRMRARIGAEGVGPAELRALVEWSDAHSPVGCTVRQAPPISLEVEVV